jgi:hypothetical protein
MKTKGRGRTPRREELGSSLAYRKGKKREAGKEEMQAMCASQGREEEIRRQMVSGVWLLVEWAEAGRKGW